MYDIVLFAVMRSIMQSFNCRLLIAERLGASSAKACVPMKIRPATVTIVNPRFIEILPRNRQHAKKIGKRPRKELTITTKISRANVTIFY
jgi:hypothetical protein